nr:hypothetical protein I302_05500 [Kwoniella bestiolae CBS 10118]OCF25676.1 hypothetical protein I302_05500 [Kwoniella bestiolae CBS 10118]
MTNGLNACAFAAANLSSARAVAVSPSIWRAELCGAEVTVTNDGQPISFPEGNLFIADQCEDCAWNHVDIGAEAANVINGAATCKNPKGFSFEITDNIIGPTWTSHPYESLNAWKAAGEVGSGGTGGQTQSSAPPPPDYGASSSSWAPPPPASTPSQAPPPSSYSPQAPPPTQPADSATQTWNVPAGQSSTSAWNSASQATGAVLSSVPPGLASASHGMSVTSSSAASPAGTSAGRWGGWNQGNGNAPLVGNLVVDGSANTCRRRRRRRGLKPYRW